MLLVSFAVMSFLAWAAIAKVSEVAIAPGEVIPSGYTQIVQHLEGGILTHIHVKEGYEVLKGDVLLELDGAGSAEDFSRLQLKQISLKLQAERLRAFLESRSPAFDEIVSSHHSPSQASDIIANQQKIFDSMINAKQIQEKVLENQIIQKQKALIIVESQLETVEENIKIAKETIDIMKTLSNEKVVSKMAYLEKQESYNNILGSKNQLLAELSKAQQAVIEYENRLSSLSANYQDDAYRELEAVEAEMDQNEKALKKLHNRVERLKVRAPVRGLVKGLQVNTIGGVIPAGQALMEIVPLENGLIAEVRISPRDVGHIDLGQNVRVRVSSYDSARYGVVNGILEFVSATTFADESGRRHYRGRVLMDKYFVGNDSRKNVLRPGMIVQADILTGEKTVISYLLRPIHQAVNSAFTER
jgi:HlyD family secretion protein/adhesin transport system membrane fusion protein